LKKAITHRDFLNGATMPTSGRISFGCKSPLTGGISTWKMLGNYRELIAIGTAAYEKAFAAEEE
jgi:hypothetical protein